eukprot:6750641-Lingulodinium_polyedra.AAC.1
MISCPARSLTTSNSCSGPHDWRKYPIAQFTPKFVFAVALVAVLDNSRDLAPALRRPPRRPVRPRGFARAGAP